MAIKLDKELEQNSQASRAVKEAELAVNEVRLLLAADASNEREILKGLSLDHSVKEAENKQGELMTIEKLQEQFGNVYTTEDISKIAYDYNLRFLPTARYRGRIDTLLASRVRDFCQKSNIPVNNAWELQNNFYILAPERLFSLEGKQRPIPPKPIDPLLFYRISNRTGEEYYTLIHKWGNDLNIFRLFVGYMYRSSKHYVATISFLVGCAAMIASGFFGIGFFVSVFVGILAGFVCSIAVHSSIPNFHHKQRWTSSTTTFYSR